MAEADVSAMKTAALARYEQAFLQVAEQLQADLKAAAPVGAGTGEGGRLVDVISVTVNRLSETTFRFVAEAPVIQALTTNYGARAHIIVPRRPGGVLAFYWPTAGRLVFTRQVNHPGNVGTRWWSALLEKVSDRFGEALGV